MNKRTAITITRAMVTDSFLRGRLERDGMDKINEALDADDEPDAPQWEGVLEVSTLVVFLVLGLLAFFGMITWFMVI